MNPDGWVRSAIRGLEPPRYPIVAPGLLRMDANTNLLGINPVLHKVFAEAAGLPIHQYPSAFSDDLLAELANHHSLPVDQLITGNGSDELFDFITKSFLDPGDVVAVPAPTFVMHPFYGRVNLGQVIEVPLLDGFRLDVRGLLREKAKLTIVASPNNPTGNVFAREDLLRLICESRGLVVVDEAYAEYSEQNFLKEAGLHPNLIVTRTFSKAHGLAALRVGYAAANEPLMERLRRVKPAFTVNLIAERAAIASLRDPSFLRLSVETIRSERVRLAGELRRLGHTPFPTDANFMVVDMNGDSRAVVARLKTKGILVRDLTDFHGLSRCIRVTIGAREQNDRFLEALRA
jgi:histidinol-phosphate aminotransferase